MLEEVEYYLEHILKKQLNRLGIYHTQLVLDSVRLRIYSLLFHWDDTKFRNTILLTGLEEGHFYLPEASDIVKSFVVVTIRNSYLESAGSSFYQKHSFERRIQDEEMKIFTSSAIEYFKKLDFSKLSRQIKLDSHEDYYQNIIVKYPDSYKVLEILANTNKNEIYFEKMTIMKCSNLFLQGMNTAGSRERTTTEDGIDENIGLDLLRAIQQYIDKQLPFITISFKHITRNFKKLLRVTQFMLEQNVPLVSCNYYISNGYVARRNMPLRPAHTENEREVNIRNVTGLSKKHAKVINDARRNHRI